MATTWGTSHFTSRAAAIRYYKDYHYPNTAQAVDRKIKDGEIHIGRPTLKPGERLGTTDGGKRYTITASNPRRGHQHRKNGRSYARKGVSIGVPRYSFDPKVGDQFYISGTLVTIKRKDSEGMLWFNKSVDGMTAMSESNLYQASYVPEDSRFAPYEYRIKKNPTPVRVKVGKKIYNGKARKVNGKVKIYLPPGAVAKLNPERKWTIAEIRAANRAADLHFFDAKTMKFFGTKIESGVSSGPGGIYFVSSELYGHGPRTYKLRKFDPSTSRITSGEDFRDKEAARVAARMRARG